jgi:hypothetical protein
VSRGVARRDPPWRRPRDDRVPLPPTCPMPLSSIRSKQDAITLSAPCSVFPSSRRTSTFPRPLPCTCSYLWHFTISLTYLSGFSSSGWVIPSWLSFSALGLLPSFSLLCFCFFLVRSWLTFDPSISQRRPVFEGILNVPTLSLSSSSPSATSSSSLAQSTQIPASLPPRSASLANRMEGLDCSMASLDYNLRPSGNLASASLPGPLVPPNSPASQSLQASQNLRQQPYSGVDSNPDPDCE